MAASGWLSRSCMTTVDSTVTGLVDHLGQLAAGERVDLVLQVGVAPGLRRRRGGVDAEGVLGEVAAVGGDEAERAGVVAEALDHGGDRVAARSCSTARRRTTGRR